MNPNDLWRIAETAVTDQHALQRPTELAEFLILLRGINPKIVVELGVWKGGMLYAFCNVAPVVIGIDNYQDDELPASCYGAQMIVGNTHDPDTLSRLMKLLDGEFIDCLFIDADHSYDPAMQDYSMYGPLVRSGGLIVFHDIVSDHPLIHTDQVWQELKDDAATEIIDPNPGGLLGAHQAGIGVLRK
jgi:cephalosporin hydroxylase